MEVIAVFRGPAHVLVGGNDAQHGAVPTEAFGVPVREAFPEPKWRVIQATMDAVYADGLTRLLPFEGGCLTVQRIEDQGRVLGVATHYAPPQPVSPRAPQDLEPVASAG